MTPTGGRVWSWPLRVWFAYGVGVPVGVRQRPHVVLAHLRRGPMALRLLPDIPDDGDHPGSRRPGHPSLDPDSDPEDDPVGDAVRHLMARDGCGPHRALSLLIRAAAHADRSIAAEARDLLSRRPQPLRAVPGAGDADAVDSRPR